MKPNELIKILDSSVIRELTIYYCGGHITVNYDSCPFELPDYEIVKLWADDCGRGISVLLADGIAAEREPAPDDLTEESATAEKAKKAETAENAEKAADTLRKYCDGFNVCSKSCVFYNKDNFGCRVNFPEDYKKKDGKT